MVAAEIMPRSATTQTRPMPKRSRSRSTTGSSTVTSAVLPGHISEQIGRPSPSMHDAARIICFRSGRWSFECAVLAEVLAAGAAERQARWCPGSTTESSLNRLRRRSNRRSSIRSLMRRGARVAPAAGRASSSPSQAIAR